MIAPRSVIIMPVCCSRAVNISTDRRLPLLLWENLCVFLFLGTAVQSNREHSGENIIETFFFFFSNAHMPGSKIPLNFNSSYFSCEVFCAWVQLLVAHGNTKLENSAVATLNIFQENTESCSHFVLYRSSFYHQFVIVLCTVRLRV